MTDYPVHVEVTSPPRFDRIQLLLRLLLTIALGWLGITAGWLIWGLYAVLPLIAALAISTSHAEKYTTDVGPRMWRGLSWLLELSAYMVMLTDRFPTGENAAAKFELRVTGTPTIGSSLARLITSIPSGVVLVILWFVSAILWLIGAVVVLLGGPMPESILGFQRGVLRWQTRLLAYHASLVAEYPPFSFDTDDGHHDAGDLAATGMP